MIRKKQEAREGRRKGGRGERERQKQGKIRREEKNLNF